MAVAEDVKRGRALKIALARFALVMADFGARTVTVRAPLTPFVPRRLVVYVEFAAPFAIECLVRDIVTPNANVVAEAHLGAGRADCHCGPDGHHGHAEKPSQIYLLILVPKRC
jgi:hypothetical protein